MPQRVLILDVEFYLSKDAAGKPDANRPNYRIHMATPTTRGNGLAYVNASTTAAIVEAIKPVVPCIAEIDYGLAGAFRGEGRMAVVGAKAVSAVKLNA